MYNLEQGGMAICTLNATPCCDSESMPQKANIPTPSHTTPSPLQSFFPRVQTYNFKSKLRVTYLSPKFCQLYTLDVFGSPVSEFTLRAHEL